MGRSAAGAAVGVQAQTPKMMRLSGTYVACNGLYNNGGAPMNNIIYIVGLVVIVIAVLSWLGLR
jgi:hypothetical protein